MLGGPGVVRMCYCFNRQLRYNVDRNQDRPQVHEQVEMEQDLDNYIRKLENLEAKLGNSGKDPLLSDLSTRTVLALPPFEQKMLPKYPTLYRKSAFKK